ncbi:MAG: hypothetical protein K0Q95_1611 [Bacteroidota bacterium]|jgi:hypothetical protein|nr:hypothetical protein [Bacteroidota bacterium]
MIRRLLAICTLLLVFVSVRSQPYGNEWISYSQSYYKIKIAQNGIYRIGPATLAAAGIDLSTVDPHHFQIFNKGKQQNIYVEGESDNVFGAGDFIEFYAEKNDGALDSLLYRNTAFLPNPYYSLVNDTAVYYLTWDNSTNGSRMDSENDTLFAAYGTPVNYFFKEEIHDFHSEYYIGETNNSGGTDSRYTKAEGWFDGVINLGQSKTYNMVNTSFAYTAGPNAIIRTVAVGASKDVSLPTDHHLKIQFGTNNQLADTNFWGYAPAMFAKGISPALLGSTTTPFVFTSVADPTFNSNRTAVAYIYLKYPHLPNLENQSSFLFYLQDNTLSAKSYLNLSNFNPSGVVRLYDLTNGKRVKVVSGATYKALVTDSPDGSEKKCFITSEGNITNITSIIPVSPSAQFTDYTAIPADSAYIIISNKALISSATDYKTYRSSLPGGSHNVVLADIDELYDQFAYGIVKSPLAIRGFADFMLDQHPLAPPRDLFLLGKSIHLNSIRQNAVGYISCFVPSYGYPSSDNLLTSGLNGTNLSPAIPTGRLSARTDAQVKMYLDKMVEYEGLTTPEEWMKYVLHFGGGSNTGEQSTFRNYLNAYKDTIEDVKFGGNVIKEFFKNSSAPITINSSDTLRNLIDNGVSLMTFFGHASGTGFDQSIDDWSTYHPKPGRYPFLLANSCYAGDFHSAGISSSEEYIFLDGNGVIGYLGSVGLGVPYALNYFSAEFYAQLARKNYNKPVGKQIQQTILAIQPLALSQGDSIARNTCYEMNLQGDPGLKIHSFDKPDYEITNNDVYFVEGDSITVNIVRRNLGMATNQSIFTEVTRIYPDGDTVVYLNRSPAPKFRDTITIKIPFDYVNAVGLNKIKVTVDRNLEVDELNENNNSTTLVDLLINGGSIIPVYPYEFAIIPKDTVTLKASTANPLAPTTNYVFQLDTSDSFSSPILTTIVNSGGGVVKWHPPINLTHSKVYYWRVSPDSTSPSNGFTWKESSFQYIQSKRGWEQAHFFQFKNDGYQYVKYNRPARKFDFINDVKNIFCKDGIPPTAINYYDVVYKINGDTKYLSSWLVPNHSGFTFAIIDPVSGEPVNNYPTGVYPGGTYGSTTGYPVGHSPELAFEFPDDTTAGLTRMENFINNNIPAGYYVLAYSQMGPKFGTYPAGLINAFETLGASDLNTLPAGRPYILWGKKGVSPNPGTAKEILASSPDSVIVLDTTITTNWNEGYIASPEIGPAFSWDSLSWNWHSTDGPGHADSIEIKLIGIQLNGQDSVLASFNETQLNIANLGSYVNATLFPKIKLMAFMRDDVLHTAPQLDKWQVFFAPVPEAAINPVAGFNFSNETIQEGDNLIIRVPIQNISEYAFTQDSLLVTYWIEDDARVQHPLPSKLKKKPFLPSEVIIDTISVNTTGFQGMNALWMEVNPVGQSRSQLEQYHFNNILRVPFSINTDHVNPLLDVTFDGVHILNNDIVSAKPNIVIQLKDENRFLALNDTNDFKVFIKAPSSSLAQRVYFGETMSFIPAILPDNSCRINYSPVLFEDGTYQLLVQAKDKSDNQSGAIDYKINFEVINRSTITEVMNYPNPFSTSTRFVFTLTGSEVPTGFKIQIMTITGKIVREIYESEIGSIHIGRNISEFSWDGKDEFGDQLANGVYLYHVVTKINGSLIEKRETAADQYFKKGWGKMYLMR